MHDRPEILIGEGDLFNQNFGIIVDNQEYESEPSHPKFPESSREISRVITPLSKNSEKKSENETELEKDKESGTGSETVSPTPVEPENCNKQEESSIK